MTELEELEEEFFYQVPPPTFHTQKELVRFFCACTRTPILESFLQLFFTKEDEYSNIKR